MKIRFESSKKHLNEKLKSPEFKEVYELERVKVALAQKIAEMRDEHNMTQSELAKRMSVSQQFISQIESGGSNLTLETLLKLAQSLNAGIMISFSKKPCRKGCLKVA